MYLFSITSALDCDVGAKAQDSIGFVLCLCKCLKKYSPEIVSFFTLFAQFTQIIHFYSLGSSIADLRICLRALMFQTSKFNLSKLVQKSNHSLSIAFLETLIADWSIFDELTCSLKPKTTLKLLLPFTRPKIMNY